MDNRGRIRWGILATGRIAHRFATALRDPASEGTLAAIGSRTRESACSFASEFPGATAHDSYEALLADPGIDAVYISTPHPMHEEWAIKAAAAGKHILCEKPLTLNRVGAQRVIEAAQRHDVFLMEAFMYRCHPQTRRVVDLVREGAVGRVRMIEAQFGFAAPFDPESRLFSKALGGGGILDVGCYTASIIRLLAGAANNRPFAEPLEFHATASLNSTSGTDDTASAVMKFPGDILATMSCSVSANLGSAVRVIGDEGSIHIPHPFVIPREDTHLLLHRCGHEERVEIPRTSDSYTLEAATVARHIADREAPEMPHADTLGNMATLDLWREKIGLRYDGEEHA